MRCEGATHWEIEYHPRVSQRLEPVAHHACQVPMYGCRSKEVLAPGSKLTKFTRNLQVV